MKCLKSLILVISAMVTSLVFCSESPDDFVKNDKIINELTTEQYLEIIKPFLSKNPIILEAGAHGGTDTVILGHTWPQGKVLGFEPVEKFFNYALHEVHKHKVHNAQLFPLALFSTSGKRTFYYSQSCGGASSLLESNNLCDYQDKSIVVNCVNLDEWAHAHKVDHIDFAWLDMEGAEYYVLSSAPNMLKTMRVIITEINFLEFRKGGTKFTDLYNLLTQNGFTLYKIWGSPKWQATGLFIRSELLN